MSDTRSNLDAPAAHDLDGHLLALGGFVIGLAWLYSFASHLQADAWEPQGLIVRQWLTLGILIVPYVAAYCVTTTAVGRFGSWALRWSLMRWMLAAMRVCFRFMVRLGPVPYLAVGVIVVTIFFGIAVPSNVSQFFLWLAVSCLLALHAAGARRRQAFGRFADVAAPLFKRYGWRASRVGLHALLVASFLACAAWLVIEDNRRVAVLLGLLQTLALWRLAQRQHLGFVRLVTVLSVSIGAWALTLGFVFTPLEQWLLAAVGTTSLAPLAFVCAFALVLVEFGSVSTTPNTTRRQRIIVLFLAIGAFAELGLRTDHLLSDWLPYHRTFWVAPAEFIRNGAWPLWDFPAQYGVLSELTIAFWPAHSVWQALYLETALVLGAVALALFGLFRYRRAGFANAAFALIATCSIVYSAQGGRYPMGWRLYPQLGLRFQWVIAIFVIAFAIHRNRTNHLRSRLWYVAGYFVWAISLAWSFESGVFASCAWLAFVASDFTLSCLRRRDHIKRRSLLAALPVFAIPFGLFAGTEALFRMLRGHGPDWLSYFEYSAAYQREGSGILQEAPNVHGALWMVALSLIVLASVAVAVVRQRRYHCLPVVAACWFGVWGTSIYFVGETIEVHANGLAPVFATSIAILFALQRFEGGHAFVTLPVRAAFTPFFVLLIAYAFGESGHIAAIRAPLTPGFTLDSTADFPAIHGELAELFRRAGVRPDDRVILPIPFLANKLDIGLTLPFVRARNGRLVEQTAWLPISPIGAFNSLYTLSYERRQTYLRRYYSDVRETGWFVNYHRTAQCDMLIPGLLTARVARSANYEIARCSDPATPLHRTAIERSPHMNLRSVVRR